MRHIAPCKRVTAYNQRNDDVGRWRRLSLSATKSVSELFSLRRSLCSNESSQFKFRCLIYDILHTFAARLKQPKQMCLKSANIIKALCRTYRWAYGVFLWLLNDLKFNTECTTRLVFMGLRDHELWKCWTLCTNLVLDRLLFLYDLHLQDAFFGVLRNVPW